MASLCFAKLWNAYPPLYPNPCNEQWPHQCAIRMSIALNNEGTILVNASTYPEPKCGHGHARGAESLANWLWRNYLGRPTIFYSGLRAKRSIANKLGIIFFKDCFSRPGSLIREGDHIDLWNKGETKGFDDPYNKASQVWFWEVTLPQISGSWDSNYGCTTWGQNDDYVSGQITYPDGRTGYIQGDIVCKTGHGVPVLKYQYSHTLDQGGGELEIDTEARLMKGYFHSSLYGNSGEWLLSKRNSACPVTF